MRHSYEMGGLQFSLLMLLNQASCFFAAKLYLKYYDGVYDAEGDELAGNRKTKPEVLWNWLMLLLCILLVSVLALIGLMDRKYLLQHYHRPAILRPKVQDRQWRH